MDRIYQGCFPKNTDGTNRIIAEGEKYLIPTNKCFWKDPIDVKTRLQAKNEPHVNFKGFDQYHIQKEFINRWVKEIYQPPSTKSN